VIDWTLAALPEGHPILREATPDIAGIRPGLAPNPGGEGGLSLKFNASGMADVACTLGGQGDVLLIIDKVAAGVTGLSVGGTRVATGGAIGIF